MFNYKLIKFFSFFPGVAYTSKCSPCPEGTHSSYGAHLCEECPENTYSPRGSDQCIKCNAKSHYAPRGSPHCLKRPPCTSQDYYEIDSACDQNNQVSHMKYNIIII